MVRFANLCRSDTGAAAIEYALLGAIIGLGIVFGLITTRSSLNKNLSGISSQMGTAVADASSTAPTANAAATAFQAKGIASQSNSTSFRTGRKSSTIQFADGSYGYVYSADNVGGAGYVAYGDAANPYASYTYNNANSGTGAPASISISMLNATGPDAGRQQYVQSVTMNADGTATVSQQNYSGENPSGAAVVSTVSQTAYADQVAIATYLKTLQP